MFDKRQYNKDWYQKHREERLAYDRKRRIERREEYRAIGRRWYNKNKARISIEMKEWRKRNKERCCGYARRYRRTPKGIYCILKRNAKGRGIGFEMSKEEFIEWIEAQPKKCHYCGLDLFFYVSERGSRLSIDRKDNDGSYTLNNIVLACYRCNNKKSNDIPYESMLKIGQIFKEDRLEPETVL